MLRNNNNSSDNVGQRNQPRVADKRPSSIDESMESVQRYKKIADRADQLRDLKRRIKAWDKEMERASKANAHTMRQRVRGYYQ